MDASASNEVCSYCGQRLGLGRRYIIVGSPVVLHAHCVDVWKFEQATPAARVERDTSSSPSQG